jgi:hypothetical protein
VLIHISQVALQALQCADVEAFLEGKVSSGARIVQIDDPAHSRYRASEWNQSSDVDREGNDEAEQVHVHKRQAFAS